MKQLFSYDRMLYSCYRSETRLSMQFWVFVFSLSSSHYVIVSWIVLPKHECTQAVIRPDMSIDQIQFYMYYKCAVMQPPL